MSETNRIEYTRELTSELDLKDIPLVYKLSIIFIGVR